MTDSVVTSPSGSSEGSCVKLSIYQACVHRFQDKRTTLKNPPSNLQQGEPVLSLFMPSWRSVLGKIKLTRWGITSPKFKPPRPAPSPPCILPLAPCTSLSFCLSPPSLYSLLIGCAARVLGLHDVRELWGSGERLDPQLLKCIIWENDKKQKVTTLKWERSEIRAVRTSTSTCSAQTELGVSEQH